MMLFLFNVQLRNEYDDDDDDLYPLYMLTALGSNYKISHNDLCLILSVV